MSRRSRCHDDPAVALRIADHGLDVLDRVPLPGHSPRYTRVLPDVNRASPAGRKLAGGHIVRICRSPTERRAILPPDGSTRGGGETEAFVERSDAYVTHHVDHVEVVDKSEQAGDEFGPDAPRLVFRPNL